MQGKHEKHFGRPTADSPEFCQFGDDLVITKFRIRKIIFIGVPSICHFLNCPRFSPGQPRGSQIQFSHIAH